jgi:putative ABC transport system permease protein
MGESEAAGSAPALHGEALLAQLHQGRVKLPANTMFALVLGGLQVRMLRSTVTMVSIVLAIAFLMYTGLTNTLYRDAALAVGALEEAAAAGSQVEVRASAQQQADALRQSLRVAGINIEKTLEGNPMDTWLLIMAMLTCTVGIANAMLMSVTERFREIGTMKCLGAVDSLVVKLFLIESSLLGLVGALLGIVLGTLVALLAAVLQFKSLGWTYFPVAHGSLVAVLALASGMVLTLCGTFGPAIMAARMKPVDALRVEE